MVKYYRDKAKRDREHENFNLWLQGAYIYEALLDASPAFNALSKKKKPFPYMEHPVPLSVDESERAKEQENRKKMEQGKEAMKRIAEDFNKRFLEKRKKGGDVNDGD